MKRFLLYLLILLTACLTVPAFAQTDAPLDLDGSSLHAGESFRFTVTVNSDELRSFEDAQAWLTAVLCPVNGSADDCQTLSQNQTGGDGTSIRITFTAEALPYGGDYLLEVSFTDISGAFAAQSASYLLRGVQNAEPVITPQSAEDTEAAPAETPVPQSADAEPSPTEEMQVPLEIHRVTLAPSIRDSSGAQLIFGSTLYVGESYLFQITADTALDQSVTIRAELPPSLMAAPLDPDSGCVSYMTADRSALDIPGSLINNESGSTFSCELRFVDSTWLAANPIRFTLLENEGVSSPTGTGYEMTALDWNYYPVNITKYAATHQVQISDSRGNLICSDTVPCGFFNAEDVYVMTYKFPADWGAALPSGKSPTASITWPSDWAASLQAAVDYDLASIYGTACSVNPDGTGTLTLTETSPGRYSASCTFVPSGISNPVQAAAVVHLNDNAWQVNDLNVYLPGTILKTQAVLAPSLTLRMTDTAAAVEQIRGGTIPVLYRTPRDYPNNLDGYGAPALYTLTARVEGISSARTPQQGDVILVRWNVLNELAAVGDLPSCLTPYGNGYALGTLQQTEDGSWAASCDFRLPQTMSGNLFGDRLTMDLISGVYQTSAVVSMSGNVFERGTLKVNLEIPEHLLLNQPTEFRASLTDESGKYNDYLRAVLADTGVSLTSSWVYNYVTDCQGDYVFSADGSAVCSAYFDQPTAGASDIHFDLTSGALDYLFTASFSPQADFHLQPVTNIGASLTVKLFHAGTEMPLPAGPDDVFLVGDDYQLQFTLKPDAEFSDVMSAVAVDNEGLVLDWWEPLLIRWAVLPGGETSLNFYRDGDHFIARYDFSFSEGDITLEGTMGQFVMVPEIPGWDIRIQGDMAPIGLPARIEKKPLTLKITEFSVPGREGTVQDLHVDENAEFFIEFSGILDAFDPYRLVVGYEANNIQTPLTCDADHSTGMIRCWITGVCTDYSVDSYSQVCGTDLVLYASYAGDPVNQAADAASRTFSVKRNEVYFTPVEEGSLSKDDLRSIQEATEDLQTLGEASVTVGGWRVDSFLPRSTKDMQGVVYHSYPVIFSYELTGNAVLNENALWMEVVYETGSAAQAVENTISLAPLMLTDDMVYFELDFGSQLLLGDGRSVREALGEAVTIKSLTVRYLGDPLTGTASAKYSAKDLTFVIKVADVVELENDMSMSGTILFSGAFAAESLTQPFTVHCTQLYEQLQCASQLPDFSSEYEAAEDFAALYGGENGTSAVLDDPIWGAVEEPGVGSGTIFDDEGCWGKITLQPGANLIYTSNAWSPICYLTAWNNGQTILIAANAE